MPYVYAVMFDSHIVKIGRSTDPFDRIKKHCSDANRYGMVALHAMYAHVVNDVRAEGELLDTANKYLSKVSQESFKYETYQDVAYLFEDCRIEPVFCKVSHKPFRMVIGEDSFRPDYSLYSDDVLLKRIKPADDPLYRVKSGVYRSLVDRGLTAFDVVKAANQGRTVKDVCAAIKEMGAEGSLLVEYRKHPFTGEKWGDERKAKMKLTELAGKLY